MFPQLYVQWTENDLLSAKIIYVFFKLWEKKKQKKKQRKKKRFQGHNVIINGNVYKL